MTPQPKQNKILVPAHVAQREAIEQASRDDQRLKQAREHAVVALAKSLKDRCPIPILRDSPEYRLEANDKIRRLCGALLNERFPTLLTPSEVGRIVSDVLLGDGEIYEVKT